MGFLGCFAIVIMVVMLALSVVAVILAASAMARASSLQKSVTQLAAECEALHRVQTRDTAATAPPRPVEAPAPLPVSPPASAADSAQRPGTAIPQPPTIAASPAVPTAARPASRGPSTWPGQLQRDQGLATLESRIGQRWIAWIGAIVVFLSVVFFLKYAFQNDWIGPNGQVTISALGGIILAAVGSYFINRKWSIFGQCLVGLGLAILYAAFYGAFQLYEKPVLGQGAAFAFMIAVTVFGMALAILHNAVSTAFLAVLGGLLTPVLVATGQDSRDVLFTYLLLLNLGVVGVAYYRQWRLLDCLAMIGTFILYAGWWARFYSPEALWPAVAWLGGIYLVYLILPFLYHLVRRRSVTVERFIMALANAAFAASFAWYMLRTDYLFTMGFVCLAMAAGYLLLGMLVRRRLPQDVPALFGTIAMTVTFITLAVPMQLRAHGIMLAWVAEAPVLVYLAYRFRYEPVRILAFIVLVVGVGRLFASHWPLHEGLYVPFANRSFLSAAAVPAAAILFALIHHLFRGQATASDRTLQRTAALGGGFLALVIVHAELLGWLKSNADAYTAWSGVTALWALGAWVYLGSSALARRSAPFIWGVATLTILIAAVLGIGAYGQNLGESHILFVNWRMGACLLVVAAILGQAWAIHAAGTPADRPSNSPLALPPEAVGLRRIFAIGFLIGGLVAILALLSTEVYSFCADSIADSSRAERAGQMSITLVWSLYATGLLWTGFWRRWRSVRWGGLALFGLAALKLLLLDLAFLKDVHRIVASLVLGLLMLAASYFYHRLERRLHSAQTRGENPPPATGDTP